MGKLRTMGGARKAGLGLALVMALAGVAGSASAGGAGVSEQVGEAAMGTAPGNPEGDLFYTCTNAGGTAAGALLVRRNGTCSRFTSIRSGDAPPPAPEGPSISCWRLARQLGCNLI
jgi:hypothetical protein